MEKLVDTNDASETSFMNDRRSGYDRRIVSGQSETREWKGKDRRKLINRFDHYMSILKKIPIFNRLNMNQFHNILSICKQIIITNNEFIFQEGEDSVSMFVLIKGQLNVILPDGRILTRIKPPGMVGEMGVFTGEQRSATICTKSESILLVINKPELSKLFLTNCELHVKILLNIITNLSDKVRKDNKIIEFLNQSRPSE